MRFSNIALAASAVGSTFAAQSLCDKYTVALLKEDSAANQLTLLTLLVNTAVIGNFTGKGSPNPTLPGSLNSVAGILAPGKFDGTKVNLLQYFDGSLLSTNAGGKKGVSVNFLDGGGATPIIKDPTSSGAKGSNQYFLLTHLYQFFGILLGCSKMGTSGFPSYMGNPSMGAVHEFMALDINEMGYFVTQVGAAATSFGVTTSDATAVGKALLAAFGERCAAPTQIVPGAGKSIQAICIDPDCPEAKPADCGAYPPVVEPKAASAGGGPSATMPGSTTTGSSPGTTVPAGAGATLRPAAGILAAAGIAAALL